MRRRCREGIRAIILLPSNIVYYIENMTTKQAYTNLGVKGVAAARTAIAEDPGLTFLFDGVRTMDVMVANTELGLNEEATTKFMNTVFQGSNERVTIAVNLVLSRRRRAEKRLSFLSEEEACRDPCPGLRADRRLAMLIAAFVMSIRTTGRSRRDIQLCR